MPIFRFFFYSLTRAINIWLRTKATAITIDAGRVAGVDREGEVDLGVATEAVALGAAPVGVDTWHRRG